ncbi:MAG: hypothetical protein WBM32_19760 [Crocosphaera sp.]|jgi:transcriptional/translational regulatory protein YebC/TACO1
MPKLTIDELFLEAEQLRTEIQRLDDLNNAVLKKLLEDNNPNNDRVALDNHSRIFNQIQMIRTVRNDFEIDLVRAKVKEITIPDDSPGTQIKNTTKKLMDAVNEINNVKKVLNTIANVINTINSIIGILASLAV